MRTISYDYYYSKHFDAISFSKNPKQYFTEDLLTDEYLSFLYKKTVLNYDFHIINEQMKHNLLRLVNYIRFNSNLLNIEVNAVNEIIRTINSTKPSFYDFQGYLAEEYDIRMPDGRAELNFLNDKQLDELLEGIEFDFTVLISLLCSRDKFEDMAFPNLILNGFYFCSINKLLEEVPEVVCGNMDRIREIIDCNNLYKKRSFKKNITNRNPKKLHTILNQGKVLLKKMNS